MGFANRGIAQLSSAIAALGRGSLNRRSHRPAYDDVQTWLALDEIKTFCGCNLCRSTFFESQRKRIAV